MEIARKNDRLDFLFLQPIYCAVELGIDIAVVALAADRDNADLSVMLGVDIELLPCGLFNGAEDIRVPGFLGRLRVQRVIRLYDLERSISSS